MIRKDVIKMGNPLLRRRSAEVDISKVKSPEFQKSLDELIYTMQTENGAGIAAPQVGILQRYFAMEMGDNPRYPEKESFPLTIAINPTIIPLDNYMVDSWEGCLSIPNIRGKLLRHENIRLKAFDRAGKSFEAELSGFAAVVAQHELDHLDGILFIDRMTDMQTLSFYEEYVNFWL